MVQCKMRLVLIKNKKTKNILFWKALFCYSLPSFQMLGKIPACSRKCPNSLPWISKEKTELLDHGSMCMCLDVYCYHMIGWLDSSSLHLYLIKGIIQQYFIWLDQITYSAFFILEIMCTDTAWNWNQAGVKLRATRTPRQTRTPAVPSASTKPGPES